MEDVRADDFRAFQALYAPAPSGRVRGRPGPEGSPLATPLNPLTSKVLYPNVSVEMVGFARIPTLMVVAVLLLIAGLCVGEQTRVTPHLEASEACCGFTQCSVLPAGFLGLAVGVGGILLGPARISPPRSLVKGPLSPPPEPIVLGAA